MRKVGVLALLFAVPAWASNLNVSVKSGGSNSVNVAPGATVNYEVRGILSDDANEGLALVGFSLHFTGGPLTQANSPTGTASCLNPMRNFVIPEGITNPAGYGGTVIAGDLVQVGGGQNTINNTADSGASFPVGPVTTGVAKPSGCGEAVLVTGSLTAPMTPGSYELQLYDLFANVIKQGEDGVPFWATEAAGVGTITNLTINVVSDGADATASIPGHRQSLWRTQKNIVRITFDADISLPAGPACPLVIEEIIGGAVCSAGPNLASGFTCAVENDPNQGNAPRILKIQETASTLEHRKWYSFRNDPSWLGVDPFNLQLLVQMGDVSNNNIVSAADAGTVYAQVPCLSGCGDARRADVNGDLRITTADAGLVYGKVPSFSVAFPTNCTQSNFP